MYNSDQISTNEHQGQTVWPHPAVTEYEFAEEKTENISTGI